MRVRIYLLMFAIACLVIGGCTMPSVTINVDQGQTPPDEVTQPTLESTDSQPRHRCLESPHGPTLW